MSENLNSPLEQEQMRKVNAFKATKELLRNKKSEEPIMKGLEKFFRDKSKIDIELKGLKDFTAKDTTMSVFSNERGLPLVIWSMITEQMKQNPDLTSDQFEDSNFLEQYLKELPEKVYNAYALSSSN